MAQDQRSNLEFNISQGQDAMETSEVDQNVNFSLNANQTPYDLDLILTELDMMDDLSDVDEIFCKLKSDMVTKSELIQDIQQQNAEMKNTISSSKHFISELEQLRCEEQKKIVNLRERIEAQRLELELLHKQQVEDLMQFEDDVQKISFKFMSAPSVYEDSSLMEKVLLLKKDLEDKVNEFTQYRQDLQVAEGKLKQGQNMDKTTLRAAGKAFDESITEITTLNEKLASSVDQLSKRVNTLRFEMSCLSLQKQG